MSDFGCGPLGGVGVLRVIYRHFKIGVKFLRKGGMITGKGGGVGGPVNVVANFLGVLNRINRRFLKNGEGFL
jgi:hypothetical protein